MKMQKYTYSLCLVLLFFCYQSSLKAQATELKNIKDVAFTGEQLDWEGNVEDSLRCDIYYPRWAKSDQTFPVILSCHAGSFTGGNKSAQASGADVIADMGFVVVAPNYRTGYDDSEDDTTSCGQDTLGLNEATYRATQDANACMRFLYAKADSFHIDTSQMFLMGNSAGADLALHMHYITDAVAKAYYPTIYAKLGGLQSTGNSYPFTYKVKAICAMWGALPNLNLITPLSAVPMIIFKGGLDPGLPNGVGNFKDCPNYSELVAGIGIYRIMTAIQVPCVFHFQPQGFHAAYDEEFCNQAITAFFKAVINNQPYSGEYMYYDQSW